MAADGDRHILKDWINYVADKAGRPQGSAILCTLAELVGIAF
jgi:hypothetical protein